MTEQLMTAPEGWFPDPVGLPQYRFWSGTAWTEHTYPYALMRTAEPLFRQELERQAPLPAGTQPNSIWVWLISVVSLASGIVGIAYTSDLGHMLEQTMSGPYASLQLYTEPGIWIQIAIVYIALGAIVVFSWFDSRYLRRIGLLRPFHWAWAFLSPLAYMIGRPVIASRAVAGSYWPLWLFAAITILLTTISSAIAVTELTQFMNLLLSVTTRV